MEWYGLPASSTIPSIFSKLGMSNPLLLILPLLNMKSYHRWWKLSTISRLSSPTSNLHGTTTTPLTHVGHLKLTPALLRFLSPKHLVVPPFTTLTPYWVCSNSLQNIENKNYSVYHFNVINKKISLCSWNQTCSESPRFSGTIWLHQFWCLQSFKTTSKL